MDAVSKALAQNKTATNILNFYATFMPQDLNALVAASMFDSRVRTAVSDINLLPTAAAFTPYLNSGFFDRTTGQGVGVTPPSYWGTSLINGHADITRRITAATFQSAFSPAAISQVWGDLFGSMRL